MKFEEEFENFKIVIIDESSMLGLNLFFKIDQRLREAKPQYSHLPFGGLSIYLVGDWSQLPPVGDQNLYNVGKTDSTLQASLLYNFRKFFFNRDALETVKELPLVKSHKMITNFYQPDFIQIILLTVLSKMQFV